MYRLHKVALSSVNDLCSLTSLDTPKRPPLSYSSFFVIDPLAKAIYSDSKPPNHSIKKIILRNYYGAFIFSLEVLQQ